MARPHHPYGSSRKDYLIELVGYIKMRSEPHRWWRTHKNPYGCWICDAVETLEELTEMLNNQSPPSLVTDDSQDNKNNRGQELLDSSEDALDAVEEDFIDTHPQGE